MPNRLSDLSFSIEKILGSSHAATFSGIGQHAPEQDSLKAVQLMHEKKADVIVGEQPRGFMYAGGIQ
jgi:hypothetical protein